MKLRGGFIGAIGKLISPNKQKSDDILPPFFERDKANLCAVCENANCVDLCPTKIIKISDAKTPILDFSNSGCNFCKDCASSCEAGIFSLANSDKINAIFEIDPLKCMAWHKSMCASCLDACMYKAIKFTSLFYPTIEPLACIACGFCIGKCPTNAINIKAVVV